MSKQLGKQYLLTTLQSSIMPLLYLIFFFLTILWGRGLHWLKHSAHTGITTRQKSHWTMNRHLKNEGQAWKTGHANGKSLMVKEGSKDSKYVWCTLYTRMNTEYLNLLKEEKWRGWTNLGSNIYSTVAWKCCNDPLCIDTLNKNVFSSKTEGRKVKQVPSGGWY
jgi:hypothetical protein